MTDLERTIAHWAHHVVNLPGWLSLQLEVTSSCFQNCAFCQAKADHNSGRVRGSMDAKRAFDQVEAIRKASPFLNGVALTGGDPQAWGELPEFLALWLSSRDDFRKRPPLRITTAMMIRPDGLQLPLYRRALSSIRVSLDGLTRATMFATRGVEINGQDVLDNAAYLRIPTGIYTVVSEKNEAEIRDLVATTARYDCIVKHTLAPRIDARTSDVNWTRLRNLAIAFPKVVVVPPNEPRLPHDTVCWAARVAAHIKPNGDFYGCCLAGGEAVATDERFRLGNINEHDIKQLLRRAKGQCFQPYGNPDYPCDRICLLKQRLTNLHAQEAHNQRFTLP